MTPDEYLRYQGRLFAGLFSAWIKTETNVDFWDENNAEDMLIDMLQAFILTAFPENWQTKLKK